MEHLKQIDPDIYNLVKQEEDRQYNKIRLIPSENYTSKAVMEATGTVLTNKYSEGYAGKRYYQGQEFIDQVEIIAIERAKSLFNADHANVQALSGSPANMAVYFALVKPGDTIMGHSLPHGGHLTHGWNASFSGQLYNSISYTLNKDTGLLDYDQIRELAKKEKPKLIWAGASAYPRIIDFKIFSEIAKEVNAYFIADIAHIAGLIAGNVHPSPTPFADAVTSTTHKTLRGPRGGLILCKSEYAKAIDKSVFPVLQGGPHNHTTAAIAVALKEASTDDFKLYAKKTVDNAKVLAKQLLEFGFNLVTGGTDNHLILIDLTNKNVAGKPIAKALDLAGIVLNANSVPYDKRTPFDPSGIRLGTPAVTSRGMGENEMKQIAQWINEVTNEYTNETKLNRIAKDVKDLCKDFPPPGLENI
ncbi:MAG: serine hydroxymethyltransferase [Spirochaetota bacterium]|nr:serine hydroxymethyltransferase [Spirochaetota bacterium]